MQFSRNVVDGERGPVGGPCAGGQVVADTSVVPKVGVLRCQTENNAQQWSVLSNARLEMLSAVERWWVVVGVENYDGPIRVLSSVSTYIIIIITITLGGTRWRRVL